MCRANPCPRDDQLAVWIPTGQSHDQRVNNQVGVVALAHRLAAQVMVV